MRYNFGRKAGWLALLLSALLMASACNVGDTANRQPTPDDQVDEDTGNDPDPEEDTGNDPDPDPDPEEDTGNDPDPEEDTGSDPDPEEDTGNDPDPEEDTGSDPEPAPQVGSIVQQSAGAQKASSESYQLRLNLGAPTAAPAEGASYKARPATAAGN
ncbi:hypothetical protein FRC98_19085 [Lujinxingia vulgaris]|uniref:Uncharacterized protein n=1 Tax=Lujinxingia vulgaris TaxID=2600176 RepID=A0A5C6WXH3_9DELT|nr:hypothetical protein [Lujinxingia vulgaris]TXD34143.1 hypothetical protein FRC98_19085 [Lujinxingia vulgaris]